jgi:hypothetical protein
VPDILVGALEGAEANGDAEKALTAPQGARRYEDLANLGPMLSFGKKMHYISPKSNPGTQTLNFRKKEDRRLYLRTVGQGSVVRPNHSVGSAAMRNLRRSIHTRRRRKRKAAFIVPNTARFSRSWIIPLFLGEKNNFSPKIRKSNKIVIITCVSFLCISD